VYRVDLTALLVVTIWGVSAPFRKAALAEFDVLPFTALCFLGLLALGWSVFGWHCHRTGTSPRLARADVPRLALSGICGYTLYLLLGLLGLRYTTAFSNSLMLATTPLFAALLLWVCHLEPLGSTQWLGSGLALLGMVAFVWDKLQTGLTTASLGDGISLVAAIGFAGYTVLNKRLIARYPLTALMTWTLTMGAIPALAIAVPALGTQDWSRISLLGWSALLWTIVMGVYVAWALWNWVVARMAAARATLFMYLVPVVSGLVAWMLLGEHFGVLKVVGAAVTLRGLALTRRGETTGKVRADGPHGPAPGTAVARTGSGTPGSI
jgi:drug/metabolite transporter (DMT)-like permease